MTEIKVSLITTIKNEAESIKPLLYSILNQSKKPDQIIIVDAGSTDDSVKIIDEFSNNYKINIEIIVREGINIAKGRNMAINKAKNDIIAITDAGCVLDSNWLKNIIEPFKVNDTDIVAGWFEPVAYNDFEDLVGELLYPKIERVMKNKDKFLPSSRSIALKKECWDAVGGYPEYLETAEDTLFDIELKEKEFNFVFAENAVVFLKVRPNFRSIFKQYFRYRRGDGHIKLFFVKYWGPKFLSYIIAISLLIMGYFNQLSFEILLILVLIYLGGYSIIIYKNKRIKKAFLIVPALLLTTDIAGILGYLVGSFERIKHKQNDKIGDFH